MRARSTHYEGLRLYYYKLESILTNIKHTIATARGVSQLYSAGTVLSDLVTRLLQPVTPLRNNTGAAIIHLLHDGDLFFFPPSTISEFLRQPAEAYVQT